MILFDFFQKREQPLNQTKPKRKIKPKVKVRVSLTNGEVFWSEAEDGQTIEEYKKTFKEWIEKLRKEDKEMETTAGWIYAKEIVSFTFYGEE